MRWAAGVTTVPDRRAKLAKTLASMAAAKFPVPRLFVDGASDGYGDEVTYRMPRVRTAVNWSLSIVELYAREPRAERYIIVQDDVLFCRNLRLYLDRCAYPDKGYWNLYTYSSELNRSEGWHRSNQHGLGALALVFSREALIALFTSRHFVERPQDLNRGHRAIDGGVVTAMGKQGWSEFVHRPSLCQHDGYPSTMCEDGHTGREVSYTFPGEDFDACELVS